MVAELCNSKVTQSYVLHRGPARRPPPAVIEGLKNTNKSLKLGQMLCRSRSPDFLLDIIQRQVRKDKI